MPGFTGWKTWAKREAITPPPPTHSLWRKSSSHQNRLQQQQQHSSRQKITNLNILENRITSLESLPQVTDSTILPQKQNPQTPIFLTHQENHPNRKETEKEPTGQLQSLLAPLSLPAAAAVPQSGQRPSLRRVTPLLQRLIALQSQNEFKKIATGQTMFLLLNHLITWSLGQVLVVAIKSVLIMQKISKWLMLIR